MIKFAWDTEKSCADLLVNLDEAGIVVGDQLFLSNVVDPEDFTVTYNAVAYTEGEEEFPERYDEAQAIKEFLKLLHTIIMVGV